MNIEKIKEIICPKLKGSGKNETIYHSKLQDELFNTLSGGNTASQDEIIKNLQELLKQKDQEIERFKKDNQRLENLVDAVKEEKTKVSRRKKDIETYTDLNIFRFFKTEDGKVFNPDPKKRKESETELLPYEYDENETAFERNLRTKKINYRDYQKDFIQNWSVSEQKLVILYYGVGSGKTLIALNCAEQFTELNDLSRVYLLLPASLVLGTIQSFFRFGIDPTRKNKDGQYIYNFISYQQLLISQVDFGYKSLLIIDEAHNLRNIKYQEIKEKESARKWVSTGNFTLLGNKVSQILMEQSSNFLRTIMMTGTLLVNSPDDLEALISIGNNKPPLLEKNRKEYDLMLDDEKLFKNYYQGLISYYKIPFNKEPKMPKTNFQLIPIISQSAMEKLSIPYGPQADMFFLRNRNEGMGEKIKYTIDYIKKNPNKKILIYAQYVDLAVKHLKEALEKENIKFGYITGELSQIEKLNQVRDYNTDKVKVLVFTLSIKEGISFKETDDIIILQSYWNWAIMEQVIARGIRLDSHSKGIKSTINVKYFVVINQSKVEKPHQLKNVLEVLKNFENVFNKDIKTLQGIKSGNSVKQLELPKFQFGVFESRDLDMLIRNLTKQMYINNFEKRLLADDMKFENVNNLLNNEFIKIYNDAILEEENRTGKELRTKEKIKIKKNLYQEFYKEQINKINKSFEVFDKSTYSTNRNPDIEEKLEDIAGVDKSNELRAIWKGKTPTLDKMFSVFGFDRKQTIQDFQAFFTPKKEVQRVIDFSGILNDNREKILVLEPTAGVGNMIRPLVLGGNKQNYMIDCNEFNKIFYQIGNVMFENVDNVKWINCDFYLFQSQYLYDYILGNPPFNLSYKLKKLETQFGVDETTGKKITFDKWVYEDIKLYDIDFVAKSYNLLKENGILCIIISDTFTRRDKGRHAIFNEYLKYFKKLQENSVEIIDGGEFKEDETIVKEQTTRFGMKIIKIKKIPKTNMILDKDELQKLLSINNNEEVSKRDVKKLIGDDNIELVNVVKPKKPSKKKVKEVKE